MIFFKKQYFLGKKMKIFLSVQKWRKPLILLGFLAFSESRIELKNKKIKKIEKKC